MKPRLTYANVVATLALFVALGGGAYALSKESVKSKHIRDNTIISADVKDNRGKKGGRRARTSGSTRSVPTRFGRATSM